MKNLIKKIIPLALWLCSSQVSAQTTLISNINGYTLQENRLVQFNAIAFTDDKVDKLYGKNDHLPLNLDIETSSKVSTGTFTQNNKTITHIDGQGKTLLPGLIDAHGHVLNYGLSLLRIDLTKSDSEQEAVQQAVNYSMKNTQLSWLQGRGWNQVNWPGKQFPSAASLDKYFPDQPVWLRRIDGHAGWANTKAMQLAGINKQTITPLGGEIMHDSQGAPTGIFIDNAMSLIDNKIAQLTVAEQKSALFKAMQTLASLGLTSVHDAGIKSTTLTAYKQLVSEQKMPIRINAMLDMTDVHWPELLKQGKVQSKDDHLWVNSVKISADGALGSRGAALIADYSDKPGHKGLLLFKEQRLTQLMKTAMDSGFQVNTHAIGDNANKLVLDNYQRLSTTKEKRALRHRIEHAQVLRLTDINRFKDLGIIASMQATHATSDKNMALDRLGKERIKGAYAWNKLLKSGAVIAAGSDFPIESANPFYGLHASVTRQDHNNQPQDGWYKDEKMSRLQAFRSFSYDAAYAGHQESIIGSLKAGKKADFILIDQDIFTIPVENIWKTQVYGTWVNGKQTYKNDNKHN